MRGFSPAMSLPLPLHWLGMPALALKMSLFIPSPCSRMPLSEAGGLIFDRNFYGAERNSGVTCRALGSCVEAGLLSQEAAVGRALGHGGSHWQP